jgi:hypothetical protein
MVKTNKPQVLGELIEDRAARKGDRIFLRFAIPRFVEFMGSLPKTPTERVQKYILKQAGVTANTWDREKAGIEVKR